ncbi:hypothetical protein IFM12275_51970 [Nocardia sputorum]|nr:hypothetical protein IFM12275_51970 [Nocardia sputorum]
MATRTFTFVLASARTLRLLLVNALRTTIVVPSLEMTFPKVIPMPVRTGGAAATEGVVRAVDEGAVDVGVLVRTAVVDVAAAVCVG